MKVLALDLGTKTGFAFEAEDYGLSFGTWTLAKTKELKLAKKDRLDRLGDIRIKELWKRLKILHQNIGIDFLIWEDVQFSTSTAQIQLWSSLRTTLWIAAYLLGIKVECCPVGTLKRFASGSGNATKEMMAAALCQKSNRFMSGKKDKIYDAVTGTFLDDNAVDALHLLYWSRSILKNFR